MDRRLLACHVGQSFLAGFLGGRGEWINASCLLVVSVFFHVWGRRIARAERAARPAPDPWVAQCVRCSHCSWGTYALSDPPWHCHVCGHDDMKREIPNERAPL